MPTAAAGDTLVLLDNSGSMAQRMAGGASKADEAAAALARQFVPGLPAGEHAALWAFGGHCRGLQLQGAFRPGRQMQQDVARVGAPRGSTPLARSIATALAELQRRPAPRHLVVLTDGLDTCGEDPCGAAYGADALGAEITIHTIGLDMRRDGRDFRVLQCITDAGAGGTARVLEPGSSGRQLGDVLATISSSLEEPTGEVLVRLRDPGGDERTGIGFVAESVVDGALHGGTTGETLALPPGRYRLNGLDRASTVDVAPGRREVVEISSPLGRLALEPDCAAGESFALLDESGRTIATGVLDGAVSFDLPAGPYQVVLARFAQQPQRVVVREGRLSSLAVGGLGTLLVEGRDAAGEPVELAVEVFADSSLPDARPVAAGRTNHGFRLPAGAYNVVVSRENEVATSFGDALNVRVGPCRQTVASLRQRAALRICAPPGRVEIWSEPDGRLLEATAGVAVPLEPGRYNLVLSDGSYVPNVVVGSGETQVGCR
jgi:hypothetical protein